MFSLLASWEIRRKKKTNKNNKNSMAIVIAVCNEKRLRFPLMEAKKQNANYIAKVLGH